MSDTDDTPLRFDIPSEDIDDFIMKELNDHVVNIYHPYFSPDGYPEQLCDHNFKLNINRLRKVVISKLRNRAHVPIYMLMREYFLAMNYDNMVENIRCRYQGGHNYEVFDKFLNYFNCNCVEAKYHFIIDFYERFIDLWSDNDEVLLERVHFCMRAFAFNNQIQYQGGEQIGDQPYAYPMLNDIPYFHAYIKPRPVNPNIYITLNQRTLQLKVLGYSKPDGTPFDDPPPTGRFPAPKISRLVIQHELIQQPEQDHLS